MMKRYLSIKMAALGILIMAIIFSLLPVSTGFAGAATAGKSVSSLDKIAQTRGTGPGLSKWIVDIYNYNLWFYGILVVLVMAIIGIIIGYTTDKLIALLGINLGKLEHREESDLF